MNAWGVSTARKEGICACIRLACCESKIPCRRPDGPQRLSSLVYARCWVVLAALLVMCMERHRAVELAVELTAITPYGCNGGWAVVGRGFMVFPQSALAQADTEQARPSVLLPTCPTAVTCRHQTCLHDTRCASLLL